MIHSTLRKFVIEDWLHVLYYKIPYSTLKDQANDIVEDVEVIEAEVSVAREITQYVKCKQFLIFFEVKEAVEVIEASVVIISDEVIKAPEVVRTT